LMRCIEANERRSGVHSCWSVVGSTRCQEAVTISVVVSQHQLARSRNTPPSRCNLMRARGRQRRTKVVEEQCGREDHVIDVASHVKRASVPGQQRSRHVPALAIDHQRFVRMPIHECTTSSSVNGEPGAPVRDALLHLKVRLAVKERQRVRKVFPQLLVLVLSS
jgi:hypothetical protein